MNEFATWAAIAAAWLLPILSVIGYCIALSNKLTKAETVAASALADAKEAIEKATKLEAAFAKAETLAASATASAREAIEKAALLSAQFSLYREQIAREYIHREVMREVEDRLTQAIERLGDRLDRVLEHNRQPAK